MKVLKSVIEDKALSELIFRIGTRRVYGLELLEGYKFPKDMFGNNKGVNPKITQATLSRQITRLLDEGFLKIEEGFDKNKKYYSVNIDKIIEVFMLYSAEYIKNSPIDPNWKDTDKTKYLRQNLKELSNKKYIQSCQSNMLITHFFKTLLLFIYQDIVEVEDPNITLKEIFDFLLDREIISSLPRYIVNMNTSDNVNILNTKLKGKEEEELQRRFKKFDSDKDYIFFKEFCERYSGIFDWVAKRRFLHHSIEEAKISLYHYFFDEHYRKTLDLQDTE